MTENTVPSSMGRGSVSGLLGILATAVLQYYGFGEAVAVPLGAAVSSVAAGLLRRFVAQP
jgi:hypothetical protein